MAASIWKTIQKDLFYRSEGNYLSSQHESNLILSVEMEQVSHPLDDRT